MLRKPSNLATAGSVRCSKHPHISCTTRVWQLGPLPHLGWPSTQASAAPWAPSPPPTRSPLHSHSEPTALCICCQTGHPTRAYLPSLWCREAGEWASCTQGVAPLWVVWDWDASHCRGTPPPFPLLDRCSEILLQTQPAIRGRAIYPRGSFIGHLRKTYARLCHAEWSMRNCQSPHKHPLLTSPAGWGAGVPGTVHCWGWM